MKLDGRDVTFHLDFTLDEEQAIRSEFKRILSDIEVWFASGDNTDALVSIDEAWRALMTRIAPTFQHVPGVNVVGTTGIFRTMQGFFSRAATLQP